MRLRPRGIPDADHLRSEGNWGFLREVGQNHQNYDWTFDGTVHGVPASRPAKRMEFPASRPTECMEFSPADPPSAWSSRQSTRRVHGAPRDPERACQVFRV